MAMTSTPAANGSSVPACPVLAPPAHRRTAATAAIELMRSGLSSTRMPEVVGATDDGFCFSIEMCWRLPANAAALDVTAPHRYTIRLTGQVSERLKEQHWKCCIRPQRCIVGSNPTLSASECP